MIGMPVISTNVGGISSLIDHNKNGILLPSNDPFLSASYINQVACDNKLSSKLGENARNTAIERHCKENIINDLIKTYESIIFNNG